MCGIIGCIGKGNTKDIILKGLHTLDYRGYDSSGTSFIKNNKIMTYKELGIVDNLEKAIKNVQFSNCAIAHTRWATHGSPSKKNAHPHNAGKWSLVHNGIIENANLLKKSLHKHLFRSETDSEVIVALLDYISASENNPLKAIIKASEMLKGSYALAMLYADTPNNIYVARNQSPLYIAKTVDGMIVSSDLSIFENKADDYYALDNGDIAILNESSVTFYDKNGEKICKKSKKLILNQISTDLNGYEHFMLKEINDIPLAITNTNDYHNNNNIIPKNILKNSTEVHFFGCGTAYHSGVMGAKFIEYICKIPAYAHIASEYNDSQMLTKNDALYVFISQSGETSDTLNAMRSIQKKAKVIAITNVMHSTLAQEADFVFPVIAGKEVSVASTKAYNAQILAILKLANQIAKTQNKETKEPNLNDILEGINLILKNNEIVNLATYTSKYNKIFFIGRSFDYVTAMEGSLKLKEISYINCSAFPAGELKHGTLALVDNKTLVIAIITDEKVKAKMESALNEVKARKAKTLVFTNLPIKDSLIDYQYTLPKFDTIDSQIISCIPLQLLAYYVSTQKGINPDKPKNLAKSVTVE